MHSGKSKTSMPEYWRRLCGLQDIESPEPFAKGPGLLEVLDEELFDENRHSRPFTKQRLHTGFPSSHLMRRVL